MAKNIIKEIIIMLLLALAIILVLGILLYEYVPTNKIIPEKVSYTTSPEVRELKTEDIDDDDAIPLEYHIDSTDLNNYRRIQEYVPGRKNPFAALEDNTSDTQEETVESGKSTSTSNTSSTSNKTTTTTENSTGYLPDKGTK